MWENSKGNFKLCILQSPPGIWKISPTKNCKTFYADKYSCTERVEVSIEGMVLKIPFNLHRSSILGLMCGWRSVEQEGRLQFSLLVFLCFVHSADLRHFGLGIYWTSL